MEVLVKLETDIYASAKRLRLEQLNSRIEHFEKEYNYWQREFYESGDQFAQGMMNVTVNLWLSHKSFRDYINDPNTICMPHLQPQVFEFPDEPK